jgi:uroporphyrin-III C-methyltransferase/precorrin-2 dehydrogenase/sirohydrochlorin ferrochelatase
VPKEELRVPDLFPIGLDVSGRRVLVVGGGPVALRRVGSLLESGADVHLVAPVVVDALGDLAERGRVTWSRREWERTDVDDAWLVMACTDDGDVNTDVAQRAAAQRVWCVRADDAPAGTAWVPAVGRTGPATVAVHGGRDPRRAVALRDAAVAALEGALRDGSAPAGRPGGRRGRVVLVGGGPGDPGLLTRRGFERLGEADVVVVDRLAPLGVLDGLRSDVEIVDVSKVPRGAFTPQQQINDLLVRHALQGKVVVRLKGGDPYVFGRGMEEVLACTAAGLAVEVVPGVTSAVAVPGMAGVPVTHRGASQGFAVVSGHLPPGHAGSTVDWAGLAVSGVTLVLLMAVRTLPQIAQALLAGGLDPATPVVAVQDGGLPDQRVTRSTLADCGAAMQAAGVASPAVVVVGAVAGEVLE